MNTFTPENYREYPPNQKYGISLWKEILLILYSLYCQFFNDIVVYAISLLIVYKCSLAYFHDPENLDDAKYQNLAGGLVGLDSQSEADSLKLDRILKIHYVCL